MNKKILILLTLVTVTLLTGCKANTPVGDLEFGFNGVSITDENGNTTSLNISTYMDALFANTALPNGTTKEDLEKFIADGFNTAGIDVNNIDLGNKEDLDKAEEVVKQTLEDNGVDTSNMDIDIEEYLKQISNESTTETITDTTEITEQ